MAGTSGDAQMVPQETDVPAGDECRINDLPDGPLLHAISYLNAREVVQTCVLSRRWRDLWRSVPRINATADEFYYMAETEEECDVLFKKFVNRFLMLRNPVALDEFRLLYNLPDHDLDANSEDANRWIRHALQCNVSSLEVETRPFRLHLHPAIFASQCLLTSLQLSSVILFDGFFQNLQTGCTTLGRLLLSDCCICDDKISSQTLKVWTINQSNFISEPDEQPSISIPSLMHLGSFVGRIPLLNNMESLVTAAVSVGVTDTKVDDIRQFLRSLSGVTNLDFNYKGRKLEMEQNLQWCPKFNNLITLTLGEGCHYEDFYALTVFLQNSPNLEHLTVKLSKGFGKHYYNGGFIGDLEERSFTCEHLVMVKIFCSDFEGSTDDPVVNSLLELLHDNGITDNQICIEN